jgi:hypothetical protein
MEPDWDKGDAAIIHAVDGDGLDFAEQFIGNDVRASRDLRDRHLITPQFHAAAGANLRSMANGFIDTRPAIYLPRRYAPVSPSGPTSCSNPHNAGSDADSVRAFGDERGAIAHGFIRFNGPGGDERRNSVTATGAR